jgi:hypothetical protein
MDDITREERKDSNKIIIDDPSLLDEDSVLPIGAGGWTMVYKVSKSEVGDKITYTIFTKVKRKMVARSFLYTKRQLEHMTQEPIFLGNNRGDIRIYVFYNAALHSHSTTHYAYNFLK